jgi:putative hydrolase of the HAD superfamily
MTLLSARAQKPIKAILIDLGGVLLQMDWQAAAQAWEDALGHPPGTFLGAMFGGNDDAALIGKVLEEDWWETVRSRLDISVERLREIRSDLAQRQRVDTVLASGLAALRPEIRLCLVANAWSGARAMIEPYGLRAILHDLVISGEVGVAKPDPAIFAIAVERMDCAPEECIFVDDTLANVVAASEVGMAALLHSHARVTLDRVAALAGQPHQP